MKPIRHALSVSSGPDPATGIALPMVSDPAPIDRRGFLEQTARLAAISVLVGAGGCAVGSPTGPSLSQPLTLSLADYPALASSGGVQRINTGGSPIAVVNLGGGAYTALSLVCPHQGSTVQWTGSAFVCPNHGARFASDGHWTGGQPTSNLVEYPTSFDAAAGTVTVQPRG